MTKTDMQLKQDVELELRWDPKVNAAQIGISVDHGAVSILGGVDTYAEKWAAEQAVKRVGGVRFVAQELTVKIQSGHVRNDSDIAGAVKSALEWNVLVPKTVTAKIQDGWVTLEGRAELNFQRESAELAIRYLTGIVGVTNGITLAVQASAAVVKDKIEAALLRQARADTKEIDVEAAGGKVTLTGHASSWQAVEDAASAAWAAPGVTQVEQKIQVWS